MVGDTSGIRTLPPLKIALIGDGKMGSAVEQVATARGHQITEKISPRNGFPSPGSDLWIDFSHADAILPTAQAAAEAGVPLVTGTTGWENQKNEVETIIQEANIGFLAAPNFSIGTALFTSLVAHAATLFNRFDNYDVATFEMHHNQKSDSPSGTARSLAELLIAKIDRKEKALYKTPNRAIATEELHAPSLRVGATPGTHTITFDSPADTITLSLQARSRDGYALGALLAAEWLRGKTGIHTLEDMLWTP